MPIQSFHGDLASTRDSRLAVFALAGVLVFAAVCLAAQFGRSDLDWVQAPLSFYLLGDGGAFVKAAYVALGASLVALGVAFRLSTRIGALAVIAPALFAIAGVALVATAFSESARHPGEVSFAQRIHGIAALVTFLSVTLAMLLQSFRLRRDPAWGGRFRIAVPLAVASFVALLGHAFLHIGPRGLSQKVVIVLILAWLGIASMRLRTVALSGGA
jgi:hypothetical protein